jgi:hypothetical protein
MQTFMSICDYVIYAAKMKLVSSHDPDEQIKKPEIKKAMRYTVSKMLHEQITDSRYTKKENF